MALPKSFHARQYYRCADRRRVEASILIRAAQPTGAVYLAGYVVELMLKALTIENTPPNQQQRVLEELKKIGHNLTKLLELYEQRGGSRPPPSVVRAFTLVSDLSSEIHWTSDLRYDPREVKLKEADRFLRAVDEVYVWADGGL